MSKQWMTCVAATVAMLVTSQQDTFAGKLDKEEREEVTKIVRAELDKAGPAIAKLVIAALKTDAKPTPPKPSLDGALADLLKEQERCEDREKLAKVIKRLIGSDCSDSCKSGCYGISLDCDYRNDDGSINFGKFIACEIRQQELIEERQKLGKAIKRLISNDDCCDDDQGQACIETSPYHSNVVYQTRTGRYLYPVCVE